MSNESILILLYKLTFFFTYCYFYVFSSIQRSYGRVVERHPYFFIYYTCTILSYYVMRYHIHTHFKPLTFQSTIHATSTFSNLCLLSLQFKFQNSKFSGVLSLFPVIFTLFLFSCKCPHTCTTPHSPNKN